MLAIEAKLDALMRKMNNQERRSQLANAVGIDDGIEQKQTGLGLTHASPYQVEESQFIQGNMSYNFDPNNNIPTHYTSTFEKP